MISPLMQSLIDAPLANSNRINVPGGKTPAPRPKKSDATDDIGGPKLTMAQVRERKEKAAQAKLEKLFDYYAATGLPAATIAGHMGLYVHVQTGTDKLGKPIMSRVPDTARVEQQIAWRRNAA